MTQKAFLDVEKSAGGARWVLPEADDALVTQIARQNNLPEMIARLLVMRGVAPEDVCGYLDPKLATHFPDPFSLAGMKDMAEELAAAIETGKKIAVFGDFDVDGATSTAIFIRFFRALGFEVPFYIPDRLVEGYGPNIDAFRKLQEQGAEIILVCDCGITAFDVIKEARALGLDIYVFDHHEAEDELPCANHVVNPKRRDDSSGLQMLAACGVVFMACVAVNAVLREKGYYKKRGMDEVPVKNFLEIAALGTVCDMVPLLGVNRLLVKVGFQRMAQRKNHGIAALCDIAGVTEAPNTYHAGFVIGPRINAGSRVHKADTGAALLASDDQQEVKNLAFLLHDCNEKRKEIQEEMLAQAEHMVETQALQTSSLIMLGDERWHPGLSGLVAGRIKEKYNKPAVCITYAPGPDSALEGRGSGRSVEGVNLGAAFIDARNAGLLIKGGGHAMAAGFTVAPEKVPELELFLKEHVEKQLEGNAPVSALDIDAMLSVRGANVALVKLLMDQLGPFGQSNEEPLIVLPQVKLVMADIIGTDHVRVQLADWDGGGRMKGIAFKAGGTALGKMLLENRGKRPLHIAGHLKLNSWQGRESSEIHIVDAAEILP